LIVPILFLPVQHRLSYCRAWRMLLALAALSALPAMILSPSRPLWPAQTVVEWRAREHPDRPLLQRLSAVYSCYANRNDLLAPLRAALPDDARNIGFVAGSNDADYSLWRPLGRRRVEYLRDDRHSGLEIPADVEWIVVKKNTWPDVSNMSLKEWAAQHQATIVLSVPIVSIVAWGGETWCLLHLRKQ